MFCMNCGTAVADGRSRFCSECGSPLAAPIGSTSSQPMAVLPAQVAVSAPAPGEPSVVASVALSPRHPWRRYFAKWVDLAFVTLPIFFAIVIAIALLSPRTFQGVQVALNNNIFSGVMVTVVWILGDTVLLSTIGTTPARAIFGIRIRSKAGEKLTFQEAFERSFILAIAGLGGGLPIVSFFTTYFGYKRLVATGSTRWDDAARTTVEHASWGVGRAISSTLVTLIALVGIALLGALGKGTT